MSDNLIYLRYLVTALHYDHLSMSKRLVARLNTLGSVFELKLQGGPKKVSQYHIIEKLY